MSPLEKLESSLADTRDVYVGPQQNAEHYFIDTPGSSAREFCTLDGSVLLRFTDEIG